MSFLSKSKKKTGNNPIELIVFRTGDDSYIRTTTHTRDLVIDGQTYTSHAFDRKSREVSTAFKDDGVGITLAADHPICAHYRTFPTSYDVGVVIHRGYIESDGEPHSQDLAEYPILVFGWVGSAEIEADNGQMTLAIITIGDTMSAPSLTRYYQLSCPLRLYGPKCKAVKKEIVPLSNVLNKNTLELPPNWHAPYEAENFIGGLVSFIRTGAPTEYRMIYRVEAEKVRFVGSTTNLVGYESVVLALGCNHTLEACHLLHQNSLRFGGHPYMPLANPVNKSVY